MEWNTDMSAAPKDGTHLLLAYKRSSPTPMAGLRFVGCHPGVQRDGFDPGWNFAAPVGYGGIMDHQLAGWMPLDEQPA